MAHPSMSSHHQPSSPCGRRSLTVFFPLVAISFVLIGVRERFDASVSFYSTTRATAVLRTSTTSVNNTRSIQQIREEFLMVENFFDTQNSEIPPLSNLEIERYDHFHGVQPNSISYDYMLENHPSFRTSPYELRWKDTKSKLPYWAKKETRTGQSTIPDGKHVCFVHVGKTGGSTLGCSLGFSLHCHETPSIDGGVLPLYTTNVVHNGVYDCPDDMPYYLFAVRNPLDRLNSAYVYDRPKGPLDEKKSRKGQFELYLECPFWLLDRLATKGLAKDGNSSDVCKERAVKAVQGAERHGFHLYHNYRWFVEETKAPPSKILAIRNEHMVDDWNSVEHLLSDGTSGTTVTEFPHDNPTTAKKMNADYFLSDEAKRLLCYHLCEEIQVYKWILYNAVNLDENDFLQSMKELRESCPDEATAKSCPATNMT